MIGAVIMLSRGNNDSNSSALPTADNVSIVDGKQIIQIRAKGGYSPKITAAKADMPTVIKIDTQSTFDCSSATTIPSIGYQENLPPSGSTQIDVLPQKPGSTLKGLCAMGMYNFEVRFN